MESEPVLVPGISLCDLMIREEGTGKISLIGCFQTLVFPQFPAGIPRFFAGVFVTNLRGLINRLTATCRLELAESGHTIASSSCEIEFAPENPPMRPSVVIDLAFPFHNVKFTRPGQYSFVVLVNNEEIGRRHIEVFATTPPPPSET